MKLWIEQQCSFGQRRAGGPGGALNEEFIFNKLNEFGLTNVHKEEIPVEYSEATEWSLKIQGQKIDSYPIPYTAFTGRELNNNNTINQFELVYANPNNPFAGNKSWHGKVVVTEIHFPKLDTGLLTKLSLGLFDPDHNIQDVNHPATWVRLGWHIYLQAVKYNAAGFIGILVDQTGGSCEMYAPYGFKEKNFLDKPIPGFWTKKKDAPLIIHAAKNAHHVEMHLQGKRYPSKTYNIIGEIPGKTEEEIIIGSHHDSPFVSPVEDASGVAVVLSMAKYFSQHKHKNRQKKLKFVFTAGHFYGSIGTQTHIKNLPKEALSKIAMEIHIEHIALEAKENDQGNLVATGLCEPAGIFVPFSKKVINIVLDNMRKNLVKRTILLPSVGPLGEYPPTDGGDWFLAGVPVINFISNPVYLLTNDDAMKWVNEDYLEKVANAFVGIVEEVDVLKKSEIANNNFMLYTIVMKLLKTYQKCKTTLFGFKPIH